MDSIDLNVRTYNKLYQNMKHAHEYPNVNVVRLEKWFFNEKIGTILDHGCGYAENSIFFAKRGYNVIGIDVSEELIKFNRLKAHIKQIPESLIEFKTITGKIPLFFENETFDYVISLGVLEMMGSPDKASACVSELARCLKSGGKMIVSTLAPENTFVEKSHPTRNEEIFEYRGKEMDKDTLLEYNLYIPKNEESFSSIFSETCEVNEIGSWDNAYCNVKGKHFVALVTKR